MFSSFGSFTFPKWKLTQFSFSSSPMILADDDSRLLFIRFQLFMLGSVSFLSSFYEKICEKLVEFVFLSDTRSCRECRNAARYANLDGSSSSFISLSIAHLTEMKPNLKFPFKVFVQSLFHKNEHICPTFRSSFFLPKTFSFFQLITKQNVYDLDSWRLESSVAMWSIELKLYNAMCESSKDARRTFPRKIYILCADQ